MDWEAYEGIKLLGFVPNISEEYAKCNAVVVPVYFCSGTNIKVLESMAMSRPCVITGSVAASFKDHLIHNTNTLIAENDNEFSEYVINLLKDETLNKRISSEASRTIEKYYSESEFYKRLTEPLIR